MRYFRILEKTKGNKTSYILQEYKRRWYYLWFKKTWRVWFSIKGMYIKVYPYGMKNTGFFYSYRAVTNVYNSLIEEEHIKNTVSQKVIVTNKIDQSVDNTNTDNIGKLSIID